MGISSRLLPQRATVSRLSNVIAQAVSCPTTLNFSFICPQPILVQLSAAGIVTPPLSVTITGKLLTVNQTETVAITASGLLRSQKFWTTITQITTAGTAGVLKASSIFSTGEKYYQATVLHSNLACRTERVSTTRREFLTETAGGFQLSSLVIFHTNASDLKIGDRVIVDGVEYEIENPSQELDQNGFHHTEAILKRLQVTP